MSIIRKHVILSLCLTLFLSACATNTPPHVQSELLQGQRLFEKGLYQRAMDNLLPLASKGYPEAQYAVGYMYYYGYGTSRDTKTGQFWIKRAADQGYAPAIEALRIMQKR